MENIEKLANLGGTVVTVILFLYYLAKKDAGIDKMISNHLQHSSKIIKENSKALNRVALNIKELSMMIGKNTKSQDNGNKS